MKYLISAAAGLSALALATGALAQSSVGVKVGTLSCHEKAGWGFVFGSSRALHCTLSTGNGHAARYDGSISKFGVDIGYQQSGVLLWSVIAPTTEMSPASLEGHYGGLTAGAAAGVGLSANGLVGGSTHSITLQPLSIEGTTGLNVAAGIGEMTLHYVPDA